MNSVRRIVLLLIWPVLTIWPFSSPINAQPPLHSFLECERYHGPQEIMVIPNEKVFLIKIVNNDDLSKLSHKVRKAIEDGEKNIIIDIAKGTYYYNENTIYLFNIKAPDVCLSVKGNGARMIAGGNHYSTPQMIACPDLRYCYLDKKGSAIDLYHDVILLNEEVEIVDLNAKICRSHSDSNVHFSDGMLIQLSEWYRSFLYPIEKIENGYIFFKAENLGFNKSRKCYNVNLDFGVSSLFPRYRLWDPQKLYFVKSDIHECTISSFLCLFNIELKSFSVTGLSFNGAARAEKNGLMYFDDVVAEKISIDNCIFENINHRVVQINGTDNFVFKNNKMKNCMYDGLYSAMDCNNTIVKDNSFYRMGLAWSNKACVSCFGRDFIIANNSFEDFGYCAIASGAHANWIKEKHTRGIIEYNHIWYSDEYYINGYKHSLIDGGAIYIATMNEKVIVRYNYIHNISGIDANRAIYCDDGAMNVKIYGNVIRDISHGHALFSWRAKGINEIVPDSNDGIDFFYNVIGGDYMFEEKEGSSCVQGKNMILSSIIPPNNTLVNFVYQEEDIVVKKATVKNNKIKLSRKAKAQLKEFPAYNGMKKWIF